ncbi:MULTISPECIES: YjbF family lipoprotein [Pacificibacter]|uniref:YjbF family lipoprotein n=1 Tax=Pacificibacter TaxID=1042323 RepID=UPI001C0908EB|nr:MULTISPECIES: YjbF family lipoprotein [Pacificibacter]MBU2937392.1 YjbF family lipoprotein [Pacificibacter marinus]MDO6617073.1 YjbF family lipoprotein [Pacificibacter sp. 1_MG-2023]
MSFTTALRPLGLAFTLIAGLSACSSDPDNPNLLADFMGGNDAIEPDETFLAYEAAGAPALIMSLQSIPDAFTAFVRQTTNAKGEETWISLDKLSMGMKDGMIIATRGLGADQLAGAPYQTLAALKAGRNGITDRFITHINGKSQAETLAFRCSVTFQKQALVDLGGYTANTDLYYEDCRNTQTKFRNFFWVERGSRKIVQSRQWISDSLGSVALRTLPR